MKVVHVITGLEEGGAEAVLLRLVTACRDIEHLVVSLMADGPYGPRLRREGIRVRTLDQRPSRITIRALRELKSILLAEKPDVVQTWMYHADLVGGLVAKWLDVKTISWGIRNSDLAPGRSSLTARLCARASAWLSGFIPSTIVCCSTEAARLHQSIGYCAHKFAIIPNGYDLSRFRVNLQDRMRERERLGIAYDQLLVGLVARWDPQKDHLNFLRAAADVAKREPTARFMLVGAGTDNSNQGLVADVTALGLNSKVILAGKRDDIPSVMNALDLHVLSSAYGEAFPNAVAEAMACGTPCLVTDVGDAAYIVGDTGWVVERQNTPALSRALANALQALKSNGRESLGEACRGRIKENFSLDTMAAAYRNVWTTVATSEARGR